MEEDNSEMFKNANSEYNEQNYKLAEELYTKFIISCSQSRYCFLPFFQNLNEPVATPVVKPVLHHKALPVKFWPPLSRWAGISTANGFNCVLFPQELRRD